MLCAMSLANSTSSVVLIEMQDEVPWTLLANGTANVTYAVREALRATARVPTPLHLSPALTMSGPWKALHPSS